MDVVYHHGFFGESLNSEDQCYPQTVSNKKFDYQCNPPQVIHNIVREEDDTANRRFFYSIREIIIAGILHILPF